MIQPEWLMSGPQVHALEVDAESYYLDHLIPTEGIVLLYGKYGAYKTPLTVNMAVALAGGHQNLWGLNVQNCKVLYVEGDTPRSGIVKRIKKLPDLPSNLDFAFVYPGIDVVNNHTPELNKSICSALTEVHAQRKYGVVFIDSLRTSHQLPDKDSETPPLVYRALARMFPGAVVFVVHHDKKTRPVEKHLAGTNIEEEMQAESFSGSQAWINHATSAIKILKHGSKEKAFITLHQTKNQVGVETSDIELKVEDGIHISEVATIGNDQIATALQAIGRWKNFGELDEQLAAFFNVSARWIREFRKRYEIEVGPIPRSQR